ncbi:DUF2764 family protein [bacterium]|nr:DUF2764 family protein [bacterium]
MDRYYYIVSQMPGLRFGREAPMHADRFLAEAEKWLGPGEMRFLGRVRLFDSDPAGRGPRVYRDYRRFEAALRNDIASWRKARKSGEEYKPALFPVSLVSEGNPLEIETKLLKLRWDFCEQAMFGHHFDLGFLVLYLLQLQILGKLAEYVQERGMEIYRETVSVDLDDHVNAVSVNEQAWQT